jgi:hypothetical protein
VSAHVRQKRMSNELQIRKWMQKTDGTHNYGVDGFYDATVLISGDRAAEVAAQIIEGVSGAALVASQDEAYALRARVSEIETELARAKAAIPPKEPLKLMGTAAIRPGTGGAGLWVLNKPEEGWASFGFFVDGWNDLFRRFDVVVGEPVTDAAGQYWPAEPRR